MAARKHVNYVISGCIRTCTLFAGHYTPEVADEIHRAYEDGKNREEISGLIKELDGRHVSFGAVSRHKQNHLHIVAPPRRGAATATRVAMGKRKNDLEILDAFIQRGAQSVDLSTFTVTGEQLLKAIDLKQRLTQGSLFEDFYKSIGAMMEDEVGAENPDAQLGAEEQGQAAVDEG